MACILDLTPETSFQNLFEMCDQDLAARPSGSKPEPASSRTGPAADDDASTEADTEVGAYLFAYADTGVDADTFDYADTEVASSPSEAPAELAARLSSSKPELASSTAGYAGDSEYNTAAIGAATGETIAASIRPTDMQAIDPIFNSRAGARGGHRLSKWLLHGWPPSGQKPITTATSQSQLGMDAC